MTFFGLNLPASDGSDLVDEKLHLNDNMDKFDTRLNQFQVDSSVVGSIPVGTEAIMGGVIQVWNGTAWRNADDITNSWSTWYTIPLLDPIVARGGFEPKARVNTALRQTILCGGVTANASDTVWTAGWHRMTSQVAGLNGDLYGPQNGPIIAQAGASQSSSGVATDYSGARARISIETVADVVITVIEVQHQGLYDGGGNFIMLDGISWYW